ncbi:hypothetical protein CBR_g31693 [Chara braunii]|uniref:DUF659 domain-containing protein n=1 Tax=Chara braunii TaxID=69332 RepID=A0A388JY04_CHABU|nr:hypothetical protein CBR_g31693 [Chara braunii]|eukprot:GBG62676.1 hypothetical protein CBR_g31693 [Chara braunii]
MSWPRSRGRFTSLPDAKAPFQEADESRQRWLQGKHEVWEWVRQGQEVGVRGKGQYKLRCTLCNHIWVGARTKAEDHFTRPAAHCIFRTGEILYKLMRDGVSITDPVGRAMAEKHMDVREEELEMDLLRADDAATPAARMADDRGADHGEESQGRGAGPPMTNEGRCSRRWVDMAWIKTEGTSGPSGIVVPHDRRMLQKRLDSWASGGLQQQYERLWARALFRAGVPFSFMRLETTQELHDFMVSLMRVTIGPALVLPSYTNMRTRLLDEIYHEIAERVAPKKAKWKLTGCTMMTDGATTRSYKPVVNFIAAGEDGPVLITIVDMSERDKTGVALAGHHPRYWRSRCQCLLRAQSGPRRGFVDVWEDMVEDPPEPQVNAASEEVYDDSMTIPEEVEAEIRSRRKEGGDRASAQLLQGRDYEDEDEEDIIYQADDVCEGKDMIEEIAAAGKGKEVVRDDPLVSRVWDRWGGLDIVDDQDGYLHGSRHTLHMMKDIHECRRPDEGSAGVQQDRRVDTGFRATTFDSEAGSSAATTEVG